MYKTIVMRFLEYVRLNFSSDDEFATNGYLLNELLRASLCRGMGLKSMGATSRVVWYEENCGSYILDGIDMSGWTDDYKQGVLEACVKSLDLAIDKSKGVSYGKVSK